MSRLRDAAVLVVLVAALSGCASAGPLTADAATALQDRVAAVTDAAAAGDLPTAITALEELQERLADASANEQVSPERAAAIEDAIGRVRADLDAAVADAAAKAAADESARLAAEDQQRQAEELQRRLAELQSQLDSQNAEEVPAPAPPENGNGNGNGNGNDDKGKDEEKDKGKDDEKKGKD